MKSKLVLIFAIFLFPINNVWPCKCKTPPSPMENYDKHDIVFVGKAVNERFLDDSINPGNPFGRKYEFQIIYKLKGLSDKSNTITIFTGNGTGDCGFNFIVGSEYLLFARETDKKHFYTGICDYTKEYIPYGRQEAEEIIGYLAWPANRVSSIAANLAEKFMKTQEDASRYSAKPTGVSPQGNDIFIIRFQIYNSSKNHALVEVNLKNRSCKRIGVK